MKRLNYILVIIGIISVICAISLFSQEGYAINISSKNKEIIKETLNGKIDNTDNITKIILGQGWNSGKFNKFIILLEKQKHYILQREHLN